MARLRSFAAYTLLTITSLLPSPASADSSGSYLWNPPVDNEANAYARVISLKYASASNGYLLGTWEHWYTEGADSRVPNGTAGDFIIRQSDNGGASWTTLATVTDTASPSYTQYWQPFLFEFPQQLGNYSAGTLLLVGNLVPTDISTTNFFSWRSTDHGKTWTPIGVWQKGSTSLGGGIWEPFLYLDSQGRLVAVFSDERDPDHSQMLVHVVSEDGGDTWEEVVRDVASSNPRDRPGMATVAKMDNGQYIMAYEFCGYPHCPAHVKTSSDGITWDEGNLGSMIATPDGIHAGASPYIIWDPSTKKVLLASHSVWGASADEQAPEQHRAIFTNDNYGVAAWLWSPAPWTVGAGTGVCGANYSPNLLAVSNGTIRYTAPSNDATTGHCAERTGEAPIGVIPYAADFAANGDAGWIDLGGFWSVSSDEYSFQPIGSDDAIAVTGSSGWSEYEIESDVMVTSTSGGVGLNARLSVSATGLNSLKGYSASIDTSLGSLNIYLHSSTTTVLHSEAIPGGVQANTWYHLSLAVKSNNLALQVSNITATLTDTQGASIASFTATDGSFLQGMAGLFGNNGGGKFRNVRINSV